MTVTIEELAQDERGNFRFQGTATLGEGTKKVLGIDPDQTRARKQAEAKTRRAEKILAAVEIHDADDLPEMEGYRTLRSPDGDMVEVPEATVAHLVAAGYTGVDTAQQVTQSIGTDTGRAPARRGRPPKAQADDADEME